MSATVWKYPLPETATTLNMPAGATVLHVAVQGGLMLWAQVDPAAACEARTFHVVGTGTPMPDVPAVHVGSALTPHGGQIVLHVFEEATS